MDVATQPVKIKKIFEDHWTNFWQEYKKQFPRKQQKAIEEAVKKMLGCGDISKGYCYYRCTNCGVGGVKVGFSCKSRFCPRCGKLYTEEWLEKTAEKIANVTHRHLIFTIPEEFRKLIYWNRWLLKELADLVVETIEVELERHQKAGGREEKLMPGIILVIHTFGRDMKFNPHFHVLLADVAIEERSGEKRKLVFLLYRTLHKVWQYKFLDLISKRFAKDARVRGLVNACWSKCKEGFYVNVQKSMKDAEHAIFYIGRYLGRPAIAEYRIVEYDGEYVTFWYKDHETGKREYVRLTVYQFMARLVQHIPEKHFAMVRRYGFYARNVRDEIKEVLASLKKGLQKVFTFFTGKKKWRERRKRSFGNDPLICPNCGAEMELWEIWDARYGLIYDFFRDNAYNPIEISESHEREKEPPQWFHQLLMPFMRANGADC